jgi:hypothetical protein
MFSSASSQLFGSTRTAKSRSIACTRPSRSHISSGLFGGTKRSMIVFTTSLRMPATASATSSAPITSVRCW